MQHIFSILTDRVPVTITCDVCILVAFTTWREGQMEDESRDLSAEQQAATWTEPSTKCWTDQSHDTGSPPRGCKNAVR